MNSTQIALDYIIKNKVFFLAPYIRSSKFEEWAKLNKTYMTPIHNELVRGLKTDKLLMEYEHALVGKGNLDRAESLWRGSENRVKNLLTSSPELVFAILAIKRNHDATVQFYISAVATSNESGKLNVLKIEHTKPYINKHIMEIRIKAEDLRKRGYGQEYETAKKLADTLEVQTKEYFNKSEQEKARDIETYKKKCIQAIEGAMPLLERHRGWKKLLGNLLLAFATLSLAVIMNKALTGRFLFDKFTFFRSPDTAQKLESCTNIIRTLPQHSQPLVNNSR